ncbi:MAG: DUF429 domain-containing protein [Anaerolineales bacterium]|nr:DUF429 domain-containing protein [Anaerolineales bacterium]MDO9348679.1 DUF429 domain-containing protein [Anaerolineales bacterium]
MFFSSTTFIGIDPTAGRKPFTFAALDPDCRLLALDSGELDEVLAFVGGQEAASVAVNAPSAPNVGLVKKELEARSLTPGHLRGAEMRMAEHELRQRGILVSPTPARAESCPEWMQLGFMLYRKLEGMGFKPYPSANASHQWLETHPHAAFCALLGQLPLSKPTLEGRLQRQLLLYERGVGLKDPMGFFEEITRHRLVKGILPVEVIYTPEQLDALVAAYTAYVAANKPAEVLFIGAKEEGRIVLPVGELKERY